MFKITDGKGFHIKFNNGYTVSVQFGYGNYCDNYDYVSDIDNNFTSRQREAGESGSNTAECAVVRSDGEFINLPEEFDGGQVSNRTKPDDVLKLMNWAASLPATGEIA